MEKILLIEDDENIAQIVAFHLERAGYAVQAATDGKSGLAAALGGGFSLIILDLMLPGLDGLSVLEEIRKKSDVPVIITSAKMTEEDRLAGLTRMADDYLVKPFSIKELMARTEVHLARYKNRMVQGGRLEACGLILDRAKQSVTREGKEIPLSQIEFDLLFLLLSSRGKVFSREALLQQVWGYAEGGSTRTVDVAVCRLREKIESDPSNPTILQSRRGQGYLCV